MRFYFHTRFFPKIILNTLMWTLGGIGIIFSYGGIIVLVYQMYNVIWTETSDDMIGGMGYCTGNRVFYLFSLFIGVNCILLSFACYITKLLCSNMFNLKRLFLSTTLLIQPCIPVILITLLFLFIDDPSFVHEWLLLTCINAFCVLCLAAVAYMRQRRLVE